MRSVQSILVLADRSAEAQAALRKASVLARHFHAQIELFTCDTDHAWAVGLEHQSPAARAVLSACLAESHRYLSALRGSIPAIDLRISTSAACAAALPEGVAQRVREWRPDLVIKNLADGLHGLCKPQAIDMQLIRETKVPMLMIRGQAWRPMPKITVALDLESEDRALARAVLDTAECLALGCHGELSVVNCRGPETRCSKVDGRLSAYAQATLAWLGLAPGEVKQAEESPVAAFRVGGAHSGMDVLVLGGVRPSAWEQGTPTMTEALLTSLENDVLLVPRTRYSGLH